VLEKYKVEVNLLDKDGLMEIKPKVFDFRRVVKSHNLKLDSFDEPLSCPKRLGGNRFSSSFSSNSVHPRYYDLKTDKGFNRFFKNEKIMA
jgi:hypothetical protein